MITLMLLCTLIGIAYQLAGVIALVGFSLWLFFIVYLLESISIFALAKVLKIEKRGLAFVPIARGSLEGKAVSLLSNDEKNINSFIMGRAVYTITIVAYYSYFIFRTINPSNGNHIGFLVNSANAFFKMIELTFSPSLLMVIAISCLFSYLYLTYKRATVFKHTGVPVPVGYLIMLVGTNIFGLISIIVKKMLDKKSNIFRGCSF